jgi:hypothetical protein
VKPSETTHGEAWLGNFNEVDLPTACVLLDSLRFASLSTMHNALKARLGALVKDGGVRTPTIVLPERSLASPELDVPANKRTSAVAFEDFQPGAPISVTPGSDGFVGGILRDFAAAGDDDPRSPWIAPNATIDQLRKRRCRSILVVTDYIGTGNQILALVEAIARHPTIRSWRSLHLIDIGVLAYAASAEAISRLESNRAINKVWSIEAAPTFETSAWTPLVEDSVVELCLRRCGTRDQWALGYKGSCGLFATERRGPNNLPALFWQTSAGWQPLFPNRTVPAAFADELGDYRRSETLAELADRIGQLRLGRNERVDQFRASNRALLQVLVLVAEQTRPAAALAAELGWKVACAESVLASLEKLGLIDAVGKITGAGRQEIDAQKRARRRTTANLEGSEAPYYPLSLK